MRLSIKLSKLILILFSVIVPSIFLAASPSASAFHPILANQFGVTSSSKSSGLSEEYLDDFSQNDITFWSPCEGGVSKSSSGFCGDTPREMYWSFFRQTLEPAQVAGILGNIESEGDYSPTNWEDEDHSSWEVRYSGALDGDRGVGSFQITGRLSEYLHFINDNHPDVLKYFQEPEYDVSGEQLLEKVGKDVFIKIAEVEAEWITTHEQGHMEEIKKYNTPKDAAVYWAEGYERCTECSGMTENVMERVRTAEAIYEELKDFTCSAGSKSSTNNANPGSNSGSNSGTNNSKSSSPSSEGEIAGGDVTWIGDSISVGAKGIIDQKLSGVDTGEGVNSEKSYIQDSKSVSQDSGNNPSCLNILEKNVDKVRSYTVLACGTYGNWSDDSIKKVQDIVKGKPTKVVLVSSKTKDKDFADSNKRLKELANTNEQFTLADWSSAYDEKYFASDPTLPKDNGGYDKWVEVILTALKSAGEDNCTTFEGEYPQYFQDQEPWGNQAYAGDTFAGSGCGPTSMAMLATVASGQDVFPNDVASIAGNYVITGGQGMVDLDTKVGNKYNFEVKSVTINPGDVNAMRSVLKEGYMLHISGGGSDPPFYGPGGHYVGVFKLTDDNHVLVADSAANGNKEYPIETVVRQLNDSVFSAIKGGGGSGSCNPSTCEEEDGNFDGNAKGFSSIEEATPGLIDAYNKDDVSRFPGPGTPPTGDRHHNCVMYSIWFLDQFTDFNYNPGTPGDGNEVVDYFYSAMKGQYPDLEISDKPSVYSLASWGPGGPSSGNHTGIVIGIDQASDKILIAEAGWNDPGFTGVHEYSLSTYTGAGCQYVNLNKHLKKGTALK